MTGAPTICGNGVVGTYSVTESPYVNIRRGCGGDDEESGCRSKIYSSSSSEKTGGEGSNELWGRCQRQNPRRHQVGRVVPSCGGRCQGTIPSRYQEGKVVPSCGGRCRGRNPCRHQVRRVVPSCGGRSQGQNPCRHPPPYNTPSFVPSNFYYLQKINRFTRINNTLR